MTSAEQSDNIFDRAAILDVVAAALDQIDRNVTTDRQNRDKQRDALQREVERLTAQVESLQREQAQLKEQLASAQASRQTEDSADAATKRGRPDGRSHGRQPLGELSSNATTPHRQVLEKSKPRHRPRSERSTTPSRTKHQIVEMLGEAKKRERGWMEYAVYLEEQMGSKAGSGAIIRRGRPNFDALSGAGRTSPEPRSPAPGLQTGAPLPAPAPAPKREDVVPEQNTAEYETDDAKTVELPPHHPKCDAPAESWKGPVIKQEPSSDGPVFVSERSVKKRRLPDEGVVSSTPARRLKTEDTGSDPVMGDAVHHSPQESVDLDESGRPEMPTPKKLRSLPPAEDDAAAEDADEIHSDDFAPSQGVPFGFKPLDNLLDAPTSARKRSKPLIPPPLARQGDKGADRRGGKEYGNSISHHQPSLTSPKPNTADFPTPKASRPQQSHTPTGVRMGETSATRPALGTRWPNKPNQGRGPIRNLALHDLRLDDFKPNPKTTDGVFHAYNDVVRGKAERASLAGCTDRNCPGGKDWRGMAVAELKLAGPSLIGKADSARLMEQFLGDDCYKLGLMTRAEKEAVWVDARTWETANKYGRCRHRFPRPPTPEQYWRTDFPDTQDRARDKAEGERTERLMIEQRYREAMRDGGRWLFRDE
ncbi:hypothetical protein MAPG_02893 [Magnaporthiopsis poae ATCC 64411]|uniref:DNA endonuclease activator Ctp1 C-terminal domain-containing protein n=1 Tax=Magnaporthiopsis poae (strain ATCC 64411 / 73-15) TaxID=644358 RepID=A0A0C4DSL1_MAGP6|nr:hypothetical protein MAPG_02893 [Magnaporthiopsis poae ATCC 64411]